MGRLWAPFFRRSPLNRPFRGETMAGRAGKRIYRTPRWRRLRLVIFARDGWACVKCGRRAGLECDHIRPIAKAGDWYDPENLRTLCRGCHIRISAEESRERAKARREGAKARIERTRSAARRELQLQALGES